MSGRENSRKTVVQDSSSSFTSTAAVVRPTSRQKQRGYHTCCFCLSTRNAKDSRKFQQQSLALLLRPTPKHSTLHAYTQTQYIVRGPTAVVTYHSRGFRRERVCATARSLRENRIDTPTLLLCGHDDKCCIL